MNAGRLWAVPVMICGAALLSAALGLAQGPHTSSGESRQADARVRSGVLRARVSWAVNPETLADVLRGKIEYRPFLNRDSSCSSIRFIQVAKVAQSGGRDYNWLMGESNRNLIRTSANTASGVKGGYFVDHEAFHCMKGHVCSPYFRDSWANPDESQDGFQLGTKTAPASLVDYPFGWESLEQVTLESCARCVDTGAFLGCAEWGGSWRERGSREILAISMHDAPSVTFLAALHQFEAFYSGRNR
jgi:hypothetical protein